MYRVTQTKKYPTWAGIVLALMLIGGVAASQTWCWKLSKRLWHPYRRAYGTQQKPHGQHHDNYTPEHSSNGTASSSSAEASRLLKGNGVAASGKGAPEGITVDGSFPLADMGLSTTPKEGKKVL